MDIRRRGDYGTGIFAGVAPDVVYAPGGRCGVFFDIAEKARRKLVALDEDLRDRDELDRKDAKS